MASVREVLRETLESLSDADVLRALELVRHLGSAQEPNWLLDAVATNPDIHPPAAPESPRLKIEPATIEGPPLSRLLVEARR